MLNNRKQEKTINLIHCIATIVVTSSCLTLADIDFSKQYFCVKNQFSLGTSLLISHLNATFPLKANQISYQIFIYAFRND